MPHVRVVATTLVDKPIQEVFRHFADPEFNAKVDLDTRSARLVSGHPLEKDAVYELDIQAPLFGIMHEKQTITEIDPPYRYVVECDQTAMKGPEVETFEVDPDGRVRVTWDAHYRVPIYLFPLAWWMKREMKKKSAVWIGRMKTAIETGEIPSE
jgi:hypothetical protein